MLPSIKPGIKLPKCELYWELANTYFVSALRISGINNSNINDTLHALNSVIYEYLCKNYGTLEDMSTSHFVDEYKSCSNSSLKSKLTSLKKMNADLIEIKYVAKFLRTKLRDSSLLNNSPIDHDKQIQNNFWGYIKSYFKETTSSSMSFDVSTCTRYLHIFVASKNPTKSFKRPELIPYLGQPSLPYDLNPPLYQQITKDIRRIKAAGSPCPLDKVSIIPFK